MYGIKYIVNLHTFTYDVNFYKQLEFLHLNIILSEILSLINLESHYFWQLISTLEMLLSPTLNHPVDCCVHHFLELHVFSPFTDSIDDSLMFYYDLASCTYCFYLAKIESKLSKDC